jgi:hypothetical protein
MPLLPGLNAQFKELNIQHFGYCRAAKQTPDLKGLTVTAWPKDSSPTGTFQVLHELVRSKISPLISPLDLIQKNLK